MTAIQMTRKIKDYKAWNNKRKQKKNPLRNKMEKQIANKKEKIIRNPLPNQKLRAKIKIY